MNNNYIIINSVIFDFINMVKYNFIRVGSSLWRERRACCLVILLLLINNNKNYYQSSMLLSFCFCFFVQPPTQAPRARCPMILLMWFNIFNIKYWIQRILIFNILMNYIDALYWIFNIQPAACAHAAWWLGIGIWYTYSCEWMNEWMNELFGFYSCYCPVIVVGSWRREPEEWIRLSRCACAEMPSVTIID
jgi:hypothetical protein